MAPTKRGREDVSEVGEQCVCCSTLLCGRTRSVRSNDCRRRGRGAASSDCQSDVNCSSVLDWCRLSFIFANQSVRFQAVNGRAVGIAHSEPLRVCRTSPKTTRGLSPALIRACAHLRCCCLSMRDATPGAVIRLLFLLAPRGPAMEGREKASGVSYARVKVGVLRGSATQERTWGARYREREDGERD